MTARDGLLAPLLATGLCKKGHEEACLPQETRETLTARKEALVVNPAQELPCLSERLGRLSILCYGTGHVLNDLCAAAWFTYLLIFLTDIGLTPKEAAIVMVVGQLADGLATLIVGQLIDSFGHFKVWHAAGSVLVAVSFSSVFGGCLPCTLLHTSSHTVEVASYCVFAAVFNVGWAATQVSHMAAVARLSTDPTSRTALNGCRNAATMVANLGLYFIAYLAFSRLPGTDPLEVQSQYRWISGVVVVVGSVFVLVFLLGTPEPRCEPRHSGSVAVCWSWKRWFRSLLYYQVAAAYVICRLVTNVSQAIFPFFLVEDLAMDQTSKAVVPGLVYVCSFLASVVLQEMVWTGSRLKAWFVAGCCLWVCAGAFVFTLSAHSSLVYVLSVLMGVGSALLLVTVTSMEAALVDHNPGSCAFVYGSTSFLDKLTCGLALFLIESQKGPPTATSLSSNVSVDRWVLGPVMAGLSLLAVLTTVSMNLEAPKTSLVVILAHPPAEETEPRLSGHECGVHEEQPLNPAESAASTSTV